MNAKLPGQSRGWMSSVAMVSALTLCGTGLAGCGESERSVELYTHCGVIDLEIDGVWYEREGGLLSDGNGNPPPGWENPYQEGTVESLGDDAVIFKDSAGHEEKFVKVESRNEASIECD